MTDSIKVNHVRYVKLGKKDDNWEDICFKKGWIPLGYDEAKKINDLNRLEELEERKAKIKETKASIQSFFNLGEDTVWVIFKGAKLYWGTASTEICQFTKEDLENYEKDNGKYKKAESPKLDFLYRKIKPNTEGETWSCSPIELTNKDTFDIEKIDGRISKTANTQHSICEFNRMKAPEKVNGYIIAVPIIIEPF